MPEACAKRFLSSDSVARGDTPPVPAPTAATALHVGCHFLHKRTQFSMLRAARGGAGAERGQGRQCVERGIDGGRETGERERGAALGRLELENGNGFELRLQSRASAVGAVSIGSLPAPPLFPLPPPSYDAYAAYAVSNYFGFAVLLALALMLL